MAKNEVAMLEKWAGFLEAGVSLKDSVNKLADIPDYGPAFAKIKEEMTFSSFSKAILENKDSFSIPTVMLSRLGEYADDESKEYSPKENPNTYMIKTLRKARGLVGLNERFNPDKRSIEEILLCYSVGELIAASVPILDTLTSVADNFAALNCYTPESALRYIHEMIRRGDNISEPMSKQSFFHPETVYLSFIGEETGDLDNALKKSAEILEAKVNYNPLPRQMEDVLFYYGWGMLESAGIPFLRNLEILKNSFKLAQFGPRPEFFDKIIQGYDTKKPLKENLAKHDYFTLEVLNQISGDDANLAAELMNISKDFEKQYFYSKIQR